MDEVNKESGSKGAVGGSGSNGGIEVTLDDALSVGGPVLVSIRRRYEVHKRIAMVGVMAAKVASVASCKVKPDEHKLYRTESVHSPWPWSPWQTKSST